MTPYVPTWKERLEDAKRFVPPAVAAAIVLGVAGWVVWHSRAPRPGADMAVLVPKDSAARAAALAAARAEVAALEKKLQSAFESGRNIEAAGLLDRLVARQRALLRLDPGVNPLETDRLARFEAKRAGLRAGSVMAQSIALEQEAVADQQAGRAAGVAEKLREALRLQREANTSAAPGAAQDLAREARLAQAIALSEAEPLHAAVENGLALARAAVALEHWDDALKAYRDAHSAQAELNERHAGTRYADLAEIDRIDGEIATLQAAGLVAATAARERDGDAAAAAGRAQEAAASYAAAAELQRQLNEKFPRSRSVSAARMAGLLVKRDRVQAAGLVARAAALEREIAAALARRQTEAAAEKIAEAATLVEQAATDFSRGASVDQALRFELGYLAQRRGDLAALQRDVYAQLAPLPGTAGAQMLKTELSQELYARVMNANPSRNPGRELPVDSVSWIEAQEFCRRLSWVLGCRTRLPTEEEIRAVFTADRGSPVGARSAGTSDGHSHDTGKLSATSLGFHDHGGNVAEWLEPVSEAGETAPVAGGSYLDMRSDSAVPKVLVVDKHERARHIGFRIVVESARK